MVDEGRKEFQNILFSKIVPNCKKLGLLDRNNGWLRKRFTELGVIQFEDWVDTGEEYTMLDEVVQGPRSRRRRLRSSARMRFAGRPSGRPVRRLRRTSDNAAVLAEELLEVVRRELGRDDLTYAEPPRSVHRRLLHREPRLPSRRRAVAVGRSARRASASRPTLAR